jgi:23S rRNA pseudouridine1911/1915/1917 synthase
LQNKKTISLNESDDIQPPPWEQEPESRQAVITSAQHGERLDKVLVSLAGEFSRGHLQNLMEQGHVSLGGQTIDTPSHRVRVGQKLLVQLMPTAQSRAFRPEPMALSIVFEDEHILVVDKPCGLVVHPAAGNWSGTLLNGLLAHHPAAATLPRAGIVHRLDKDTTGLMVVGKTLQAVTSLVRMMAAREVHRQYLAVVHGCMAREQLSIDAPIGRDARSRIRMAVVSSGKSARTDVQRLALGEQCSALLCTLHTGRTHQIRVHLSNQGFPLIGDEVYGGRPLWGLERQALHAYKLGLTHPITGAVISWKSALPADLHIAIQDAFGSLECITPLYETP